MAAVHQPHQARGSSFNEPIIARQIIVADATVEPLADVWATLVLPGPET